MGLSEMVQSYIEEAIERRLRRAGIGDTTVSGSRVVGPISGLALPSHDHTGSTGEGGKLTGSVVDTYMEFEDASPPSTPASGKVRIFADDDQIKAIDDTGDVVSLTGSGGGGAATIYTSAYASPPSAPVAGDAWLPSDGMTLFRYDGTAWRAWGPLFPFTTPPAVGGLTWDSQGTSTIANEKGGIWLAPQSNTAVFRNVYKSAPATPYTFTVGFIPTVRGTSGQSNFGIGFRESSSGKIHILYLQMQTNGWAWISGKWTNSTTFSAGYTAAAGNYWIPAPIVWMQVADNGTNRICRVSGDGQHWNDMHSIGRTDFLTADQICVGTAFNNSGEGVQIVHWREA